MTTQQYIDEIKLMVTGGVLELEIPDTTLATVVNKTLREVQRYIDETRFVTIPYTSCIDLTNFKSNSIVNVYRADSYLGDTSDGMGSDTADPMYVQQWMMFGNGGTMYNLNDYILNFISYNTLLQMRNTVGTDLAFKEDHDAKKLYVYTGYNQPKSITLEFVPLFDKVEDITNPYWIDIISRLSIAQTKILLGRIRSRYTQSNALWAQDGDKMLEEGNSELKELQETLRVNSQLCYPID